MGKLKFGHRVLVRDNKNQEWQKARYIRNDGSSGRYAHMVYSENKNNHYYFTQCRLDPEATEFVIGDEVEVRDYDRCKWEKGIYAGYVKGNQFPHFAKKNGLSITGYYNQCRYPQPAEQPEPAQTIELNGKRYEIREVK